ncbi:prepilin-type N-terminal cleavage/methylation domain-containing protein [bacterium]|nr:prepilin-type N-terminal cleavage/methylation domain-containing protein [bacterium]
MKAASLLETLIVLAIFSILAVMTFPFSLSLINQTRADAETKTLAYMLFRQQQDAYAGLNNKSYGIALYQNRFVIFTGDSLNTAESQDTYYLNNPITVSNISLSSGNEVVFSPNSFRPQENGYLDITDSTKTYRIDITSEGLISYYRL